MNRLFFTPDQVGMSKVEAAVTTLKLALVFIVYYFTVCIQIY